MPTEISDNLNMFSPVVPMASFRLKSNRFRAILIALTTMTIVIGVVITPLERWTAPATTFSTIEDGLWWAVTTVTSVGYGDYYPVTTIGRVLGAILQVAGVMLFGLVIALITVDMLRNEQQFYWKRTVDRFDRLEGKLEKLEKEQRYIVKNGSKENP